MILQVMNLRFNTWPSNWHLFASTLWITSHTWIEKEISILEGVLSKKSVCMCGGGWVCGWPHIKIHHLHMLQSVRYFDDKKINIFFHVTIWSYPIKTRYLSENQIQRVLPGSLMTLESLQILWVDMKQMLSTEPCLVCYC